MAPRETEDNAYAKFWGDKQRTLWYVMVFLEWSILLACYLFWFLTSGAGQKDRSSGNLRYFCNKKVASPSRTGSGENYGICKQVKN